MLKIEKFLNPSILLGINAIIIVAAELAGGGKFFYETGLVHAIAILFIFLASSRVIMHYYTYDPVLEKFVHTSLAAMIIFSVSHLVEFLSYMVFNIHEDAIFANVINFYIISIILMVIGSEIFLRHLKQRSKILIWILSAVVLLFALLIAANLINDQLVSLEPLSWGFNIYVAAIICVGFFGVFRTLRIKRAVPATAKFANYLAAAIVVITLASLQNLSYELFEDIGIPVYQGVYFSHFAFYAALSLMFLAFAKLHSLGGIYDDLRAADEARVTINQ